MSSALKQSAAALLGGLILAGCSQQPASDTLPLDASISACAPLKALQRPPGLTLPAEDQRYQIPEKPLATGMPLLESRPPIQPLALLPGSVADYQGEQAILQFNQATDSGVLWRQLQQCLAALTVVTVFRNEHRQTLASGWVNEAALVRARYQLSLSRQTTSPTLAVRLIALQKKVKSTGITDGLSVKEHSELVLKNKKNRDNKPDISPGGMGWNFSRSTSTQKSTGSDRFLEVLPAPSEKRDYAVGMLNRIATALEKQRVAVESSTQVVPNPATPSQSKP